MQRRSRRDLSLLLHPYMFVLKEGSAIQKDPLNFSLMILKVNCPEVLKSPNLLRIESPSENVKTPLIKPEKKKSSTKTSRI